MKEELITFETAKLAKEKGFAITSTPYFFNKKGEEIIDYYYENRNKNALLINRHTQSLLQKWLRDIHSIYILPMPWNDTTRFYFDVVVLEIQEYPIEIDFEQYSDNMQCIEVKTYEEALEVGLVEALKLIKV